MDFFVRHNEGSQPEGPYSKSRVVEMLKNGDLPDNSTYWHEGMSDWQSVKNGLIGPMRIILDPEADSPSDSSAPPVIGSPEGPPVLPQPISSSQGISIFAGRSEWFLGAGAAVVLSLLIWLGVWFFGGGDPLYPFKQGDKWGYCDSTGEEVIGPQFDNAGLLLGDLGPVKIGGKWGYVNRNGEQVITPQFKMASYFTEGLAPVQLDTMWGYINEQGTIVIKAEFDRAYDFSQGLAPVRVNGKYGFIDEKGQYSINPRFDDISMPGLAGQILSYGSLLPVRQGSKWGYIDDEGEWIINPQFEKARPFINDLAVVQQAGKYGFIGTDGKYRINPQFGIALDFTSDLAPVMTQNKWGFIDTSGEYVINPQFDSASPFYQGLAKVSQIDKSGSKKFGYINKSGKSVADSQFVYAGEFLYGPLAPVIYDNMRMALINKKGKIVWMEKEATPTPKKADVK